MKREDRFAENGRQTASRLGGSAAPPAAWRLLHANSRNIEALGHGTALAGVVLPLLFIGMLKFTRAEIEALRPLVTGTPWLAWLYPALGEAGTSYLLGAVEIAAGLLFLASQWSSRAGIAAGALGTLTFSTTVSIMFALPIWENASGGFPWLNFFGTFLIKDVALLGISLAVLGRSLANEAGSSRAEPRSS